MSTVEELRRYLDELLYRIKFGLDYYRAWEELNKATRSHNKAICFANDFFSVVHESLLHSMMSEVIKLYDNHSDCCSVVRLHAHCTATNTICKYLKNTPQKLENYLKTMDAFSDFLKKKETIQTITNLRIRRDKYYMHSDKRYFGKIERLVNEAPFSFEETKELFGEAFRFCFILYKLLGETEWHPNMYQNCLVHKRDFSGLNKLLTMCERYSHDKQ